MKTPQLKILTKIYGNYDYISCFLIAVIILLPKIPLIKIPGIYINIRFEDYIIAILYGTWVVGVLLRYLKFPPLKTIYPFIIFLGIAAISTVYGIYRRDVSLHLGALYLLRYVEYFGIYFLMVSSFKNERFKKYIFVLVAMYVAVIIYGILNKFDVLPVYRTMTSSGVKVYFSQIGFVQSTFGGHYDFGAYLMMNIPLLLSLTVLSKKVAIKAVIALLLIVSLYLMFYSYARSGYLALLIGLSVWFVLQKSWLIIMPITGFIGVGYLYVQGKFSKYQYKFTIQSDFIENLITKAKEYLVFTSYKYTSTEANPESSTSSQSSISAIQEASQATNPKVQGIFTETTQKKLNYSQEINVNNDLNLSLDPSAVMRFNAWKQHLQNDFLKNPVFGKGLSSIGVGADGDYVRWLSELGILGTASFLYLLGFLFAKLWRIYKKEKDQWSKQIFISFIAAFAGLMVNAIFIDVFEASKIAFYFWFIMGITMAYSIRQTGMPNEKN